MTGKRFEIVTPKNEWVGFDIVDNQTGKEYYAGRLAQCEELCDLLETLTYTDLLIQTYEDFIEKVLKIMMKHNIQSLEKLDKVLFYERNW